MKKLLNWLTKKNAVREIAPQLTRWQRQAYERPGPPAGGQQFATYAAMEADSMIQTALTLKKLGSLAAGWKIVPDDESAEAKARATFVDEAFQRMEGSPLTLMAAAMDAFAKGWSVQEMVFSHDAGRWWLQAVRPKDPSLFGQSVDRFGTLTGLRLEIPGEVPLELPVEKFVVFQNRPLYGGPRGRSDLDAAYSHWVAKTTLLAAWKIHLERFASPTMLASFGAAATESAQQQVLAALNNLASSNAIVYSNEFEIDTVGGHAEASKGFIEAIEFHNREIARAILGQTLTTDEGRRVGSLALGKVHLQVLALQLDAVRRELADRVMTEQVIRPLVELNFGLGHVPRFEFDAVSVEAFRSGTLE